MGQHGNRFDHCYWDYSGIRIENPKMIEFSHNYIIGLPSRQPDPAFVEFVARASAAAATFLLPPPLPLFISCGTNRDSRRVMMTPLLRSLQLVYNAPPRRPTMNPHFICPHCNRIFLQAVGGNTSIPIDGVRFTGNVFRSSGAHPDLGVLTAFKLNETDGAFGRHLVTNSLVAGNSFDAVQGSATRVQTVLWQTEAPGATEWVFDLCDDLLFTNTTAADLNPDAYPTDIFGHLQYSVRLQGGGGGAGAGRGGAGAAQAAGATAITSVAGCVVTVSTERAVQGAVYLTADQSRDDLACHGAGCHHHGSSRSATHRFL